ncbi:MAG: hypothetical protein JWP87_3640 [Labilithrix sp.]|nr:hypothetical protein [Labilithrix sp.]
MVSFAGEVADSYDVRMTSRDPSRRLAMLGIGALLTTLACGPDPCNNGCMPGGGSPHPIGPTSHDTGWSASGTATLVYGNDRIELDGSGGHGYGVDVLYGGGGPFSIRRMVPKAWRAPDAADASDAGASDLGEPSPVLEQGLVASVEPGTVGDGALSGARIVLCNDPRETLYEPAPGAFVCKSGVMSAARTLVLEGTASTTYPPSNDESRALTQVAIDGATADGTHVHLVRTTTATITPASPNCY